MQFIVKGTEDYESLRADLQLGKCRIIFRKKNGDVRVASGTTRLEFIPEADHPKGLRKPNSGCVTFFDLDKEEWRCLLEENLIGYSVED